MSRQGRWEYLKAIYPRYQHASRLEKQRILDEFCQVTALPSEVGPAPPQRAPARRGAPAPRGGGPPTYGTRVIQVLAAIWRAAGYPWSLRLKALLPLWLPWARPRFRLTPALEAQLLRLSPRQMDRRLAPYRRPGGTGRYGRTKPGTLLKHHIPLRTDRWDVTVPGFTEIDLVAHCGDSGDGEFAHSLNLTDIHTTWVETRAVLGRGQHAVQQALEAMRQTLPFRLQGIDSDNGSEFINAHLVRYCQRHGIQFTRGRPYKKDDNAHIEQKNWTHVRKLLGYVRYDCPRRRGRHERPLPAGAPALPEPVPALGQARPEGPRGGPDPAGLRPAPDALRARPGLPRGRSRRVAQLPALRAQLDPFALAEAIDAAARAAVRPRAPPRPAPGAGSTRAPASHRQRGKRRPAAPRTPRDLDVLPRGTSAGQGNISNGATIRRKVTFLNGLTGGLQSVVVLYYGVNRLAHQSGCRNPTPCSSLHRY